MMTCYWCGGEAERDNICERCIKVVREHKTDHIVNHSGLSEYHCVCGFVCLGYAERQAHLRAECTKDPCEGSGVGVLRSYRVTEDPGTAKCPFCEQIVTVKDGGHALVFTRHFDGEPSVIAGEKPWEK